VSRLPRSYEEEKPVGSTGAAGSLHRQNIDHNHRRTQTQRQTNNKPWNQWRVWKETSLNSFTCYQRMRKTLQPSLLWKYAAATAEFSTHVITARCIWFINTNNVHYKRRRSSWHNGLNFFLGPTFANVWEQTLWNVCKTLCIRYEIVQFVRLSFRMRLTIVRIYKGWADQLCAGGEGCWEAASHVPCFNRTVWNRFVILQSLRGFLAVVGEPNRLGGSSRLVRERGSATRMTGPFPPECHRLIRCSADL